MMVYGSGEISRTIGGGKFEELVIEDSLGPLQTGNPELKSYVLREGSVSSFGAICGGEVTALLEPQCRSKTIYLFGAGHCAIAIARLARICGFRTVLVEDRPEVFERFEPADEKRIALEPAKWISQQSCRRVSTLITSEPNIA